ncbi:MAG: phage portal protein [Prevotella sp.]|jgi:HK97 family phage portal protein|nr:phage portal protein [Prevotella sp.]
MSKNRSIFSILFSRDSSSTDGGASLARLGKIESIYDMSNNGAMQIATVYRCVRLLSDSVASLPMRLMKLKDGVFVDDYNNPLYYLLTVQPMPGKSAFDFWAELVQQILLRGNAYVVPVYDPASLSIDKLVLIRPGKCTVDTTGTLYHISDNENGIMGDYPETEVLHFMNTSLNGITGLSVLDFARTTLNIADSGDKETLSRFRNGGNVRGIIYNDNSIVGVGEYQDAELGKQARTLDEKLNGINGEGQQHIVAMNGDVKFTQLSMTSADMQFLESRKFTVRDICRFFGVHPSFVFDDTSNNYKSAEMANVAFLSQTLNPLLRKIENECLRKLVSASMAIKRKFEFDRRAIYAADLASRVDYQMKTIQTGLYTVNEWRREENKPAVEGGDMVFVSANLKSIDDPTSVMSFVQPNDNSNNNKKGKEE